MVLEKVAPTRAEVVPEVKVKLKFEINWLAFGLPFALAGLIYWLTAAAGLSWQHGGDDGGDLATATALLGIPHPTGYPLYVLTGRLFLWLSPDPARALNLASAFWGAFAAGLIGFSTCKLAQIILNNKRLALAGGCFAGLSLAFAPLVWSQATITEVYALSLALLGLTLLTLLNWWEKPNKANAIFLSLAAAFFLSHHRTALFTLLGVALFIWLAPDRKFKFNPLCTGLFGLAFLAPYFYLIWRGGAVPASNWNNISLSQPESLWRHFSGSEYNYLLFAAPLSQSLNRIGASASLLVQQFGLVGLILGWLGLAVLWQVKVARPFFGLALTTIVLQVSFAAIYAADNSQVYLLPIFAFWAILMGLGLVWLGQKLPFSGKLVFPLMLAIALLLPGFSLFANYAKLDLSHNKDAEVWAKATLSNAPPRAILVSRADNTTFALWYGQHVQNLRPDIAIVEMRLLGRDWYRQNLIRIYPDLKLPENNLDELSLLNPARPLIFIDSLVSTNSQSVSPNSQNLPE